MIKRMYLLLSISIFLLFNLFSDNIINATASADTVNEAVYQNEEADKESGEAGVKSLAHEVGYVLGTSGEAISLNDIVLNAAYNDLTEGQITGDKLTWTSNNEAIEMTEDTITAIQKGVYPLTAALDGASANILLVVKGEEEEEYVLYEEDFNDLSDGSLPEDWSQLSSTTDEEIGVKSGAFEIDGRGINSGGKGVLLPEYLGLFGNYKIEADVTHLAANDSSRWNSIMYRVQNNSYPYYQMAVRQNATAANGIEFAERTPGNAWNVAAKNSYSEAISADKMYHYTVIAHGNRVQEMINDNLLIDTDLATNYSEGRIGFQSAGSLTKVDNIKVTLHTEELPEVVKPGDNFTHVEEPETSISLAPTIVTEVDSSEDLQSIVEGARPATAILHVNSSLQVTDEAGNVIDELQSVIETLDQKVIPAFAIEEEAVIAPLTAYLRSIDLEDAFVLSEHPELVKKTREAYPIIRGIIEYSVSGKLSEEQLMDIRRTTNSHLAKIVILPESAASIQNISYLQKKLMTVWIEEDRKKVSTNVDIHRMITSGTNGIVTDQYKEAIDALSFYDENITLVRTPYIFAHRGIPGLAPENTLEGALLSYEKGADHIENDIYLTKDGQIVIMHDETIDRTTNGTGSVESYTLAELKQFLANDQFPEAYPDARIPTLRQFFEEFKGKDVEHIVEIKTSNPAIIDKLIALIEEMGVENQVSVISFHASQLQLLAEQMPGMSIGYLTSGFANETDVYPSLRSTLNTIQNLNSTFNTSYGGLGVNFLEAAKHRGVTVWPWTYRDEALFIDHFLLGIYGLTTDYAHWASDWASHVTPEQAEYKLTAGESIEVKAMIETYDRQIKDITPDIVFIDGEDKVEVNGNVVTAQAEGTVHAMLRYTQQVSTDKSYDIYTQPITITVKADKKPPAKPRVNTVGDNSTHVSGTAEAGSTVYVKAGRTLLGQAITAPDGSYSVELNEKQQAGTVLTVYAVDQAGNHSSSERTKVTDNTPPQMPEVKRVTSKMMSGKAESDSTVYVYNGKIYLGKASVDRKGDFSVSIKKAKKGDVLTVYAKDKAGNISPKNNVKVS